MKTKTILLFKIILTGLLLFGTVFASVTSAGPLLQDPRPDRDGGGGGGGGTGGSGGGSGSSDSLPPTAACASLVGQVINWGSGGEGGITTDLDAGSWQLSTVSATDGNYGYGGLGIGAAKLHIGLSLEQDERFEPLIQDAGVYLSCDFPIVANIALFGGDSIKPPATIEMSATRTTLGPDQTVDITLTVANDLPNDITNVIVTNLFPPGLIPEDVSTAAGPEAVQIVDTAAGEKLVVINLSRMTAGAETTITIGAAVEADLVQPGSQTSSATLFYRESVAHQDTVEFSIRPGAISASAADSFAGPAAETDEAETPADASAAEVAPSSDAAASSDETISAEESSPADDTSPVDEAALTEEAEGGEDFVPPNGLPSTGDSFVPPPMLPVTGQDSMETSVQISNVSLSWVLLPLSMFVAAGAVFVWRRRRKSGQLHASQKSKSSAMAARPHQNDIELDLSPLRHGGHYPQKQKQN